MTTRNVRPRCLAAVLAAALLAGLVTMTSAASRADAQESYVRISGEGSSWAANAIDAMRVNVRQFGITVDYNPSGSTSGRKNFLNGTVDFAASDIPFQFHPEDGSAPENPALGTYAYIPVVAGGTAFVYNLKINGQRVTKLRLSGENVAKIFTGAITNWNDPALQADNPGLTLPARPIVPIVRSDGSGSTAQFTTWMIDRHPAIWQDYCQRSGRAPACGFTSFYPTIQGMIAQTGDPGVTGYVTGSYAEGAIGYVNYSYALGVEFPVAKVLNAAGYYTEPTPENVAVSLLKARINTDESNPAVYLTQDLSQVHADTDPRSYQLSSYSYFILPTALSGNFTTAKGRTLGAFAYYAMCQAQQQSASLGYSPMPINLVEASFEQIRKIPGVEEQQIDIRACNNPTFSADGTNVLAANAPQPKGCDQAGQSQCPDGTGGLRHVPTETAAPPSDGGNQQGGGEQQQQGGGDQGTGGGGGSSGGGDPSQGGGGGGSVGGGSNGSSGGGGSGGSTGTGGAGGAAGSAGDTGTPTGPAGGDAGATTDGSAPGGGPAGAVVDGATGAVVSSGGEEQSASAGPSGGRPSGPIVATSLERRSAGVPLVILITLLTLALIVVPAVAWQRLAREDGR